MAKLNQQQRQERREGLQKMFPKRPEVRSILTNEEMNQIIEEARLDAEAILEEVREESLGREFLIS